MLDAEPPSAAPGTGRFDVFLSYNSRDRAVVERIAEQLKGARIEPWLDRWRLVPGAEWQRGLAEGLAGSRSCAVLVGPGDLGAWANQEIALALDRAATDPGFRVFLVLLPGVPERFDVTGLPPFLRMRTWVDMRGGLDSERAFSDLVSAVQGLPLGPELPVKPDATRCPYRGLEVFEEEHAEFFFGRDADVQRLLERLKGTRFLAILGASGSGKSSLVRAGLVPALKRDAEPGHERWEIVILRPGPRPLETLAAQLVHLCGGGVMQPTLDRLTADPRTLHLAAALALSGRDERARLLLVVDQSEEIFTLCKAERERSMFVTNLLYAATIPDAPTSVLLTMRADFYHRCGAYPELAQQLAAQQYLVSPMQPEGLRQALEEPARRVGLSFEPGLVATILDDVARQPGALPLLEHALLELWRRRAGGILTLAGYMDSGGVPGAIAKRAEAVFESLTPPDRNVARRTFLRLTQPGEGTEDTRRRAPLTELESAGSDAEVAPVVARLVDSRLLTTSREEAAGGQMVEVAHEALIRGWPRLRSWIDEDRVGLRVHRRLTTAAEEWARLRRDDSALYRGVRLAEAVEWKHSEQPDLNQLEREFLTVSQATEHRAQTRDRRRVRRLRVLLVSLALLFAAAGATAVVAVRQTQRAHRQAAASLSRALAEQALARVHGDLDLAMLLSLEAYRRAQTFEARNALITAIEQAARLKGFLRGRDQPVIALSFGPDGHSLATVDVSGTAQRWDLDRRAHLGKPLATGQGGATLAAIAPQGMTLASGDQDGALKLWDLDDRRSLGTVRRSGGGVRSVGFSHDGKTVAWGGSDGMVRLWDVDHRRFVAKPFRGTYSVAFSRSGTMLATGDEGTVRIFDIARHELRGEFDVGDTVLNLAFSPDGKALAAADDDVNIVLWDLGRGRVKKRLTARGCCSVLVFSPDSKTLASGTENGTLQRWDVGSGQQIDKPLAVGDRGISSIEFTANGESARRQRRHCAPRGADTEPAAEPAVRITSGYSGEHCLQPRRQDTRLRGP